MSRRWSMVSCCYLLVLITCLPWVACQPTGSDEPTGEGGTPAAVQATIEPSSPVPVSSGKEGNASLELFTVSGKVISIEPDLSRARIDHEEIPGYMEAMVMPFNIGNTHEWAHVHEGDVISFLLHVTEERSWIDGVEKKPQPVPSLDQLPKTAAWRQVREVKPLAVGDLLPNVPLTNQFSAPVTLDQFRGKAVALTFIYTRCPLPDFCPKMNQQFRLAQRELKALEDAPDNWHFLSLSFDPVHDTPERLKFYASAYQYDPATWTFATGAMIEIDALTEQFGLLFYRSEGSILDWDHNLRTVLVDPEGIIQEIIIGNLWSGTDLAKKMARLARGEGLQGSEQEPFE
ncbi:MAG: SCO family protein [Verrucomicrobiota bacterium]|jgi:protein SCO1|nr:SCO family protein [Verrucomicrobiota bacterium]